MADREAPLSIGRSSGASAMRPPAHEMYEWLAGDPKRTKEQWHEHQRQAAAEADRVRAEEAARERDELRRAVPQVADLPDDVIDELIAWGYDRAAW